MLQYSCTREACRGSRPESEGLCPGVCTEVVGEEGARLFRPNLELIKSQLSARLTKPPLPMRNVCCTTRSKEREEANHTYFLCYMWYSCVSVNYTFRASGSVWTTTSVCRGGVVPERVCDRFFFMSSQRGQTPSRF